LEAPLDLLRKTTQRDRDETIEYIRRGMEDEKAGRVRPLKEVIEEIGQINVNKQLTAEEKARHREIRRQIEREKFELIARGRVAKAKHTSR